MYAVIEQGGKQYRVSEGDKFKVEKIHAEDGAVVTFDKVIVFKYRRKKNYRKFRGHRQQYTLVQIESING